MMLRIFLVGFIAMISGMASLYAEWSDAARVGDDIYFFQRDPARMDRYDLANEVWKDPVTLPEREGGLTAAHADEGGVYLGYGSAVYRYDLEGENETFVLNQTSGVVKIVSTDSVVVVMTQDTVTNGDGQITSFLKSNNSLASTQPLRRFQFQGGENVTINRLAGQVHFSGFNDRSYVNVDDDGILSEVLNFSLTDPGSPFGNSSPRKLYFYPSVNRFIDTAGRVFGQGNQINNFVRLIATGLAPRDLIFRGEDVPIALEAGRVVALRNNLKISGQKTLDFHAQRLFEFDDQIFAFGENDTAGLEVAKVSIEELGDPQPGEPVDQVGAVYTPDCVFTDRDGIVNVYSSQFATLFRWDPETQEAVPSINLQGTPSLYFYSQTSNRFYLGFSGGRIDYVNLTGTNPVQRNFVSNLERLTFMADAGSNVFVQKSFPETTLYRSNGTVLATGSTFSFFDSDSAKQIVWDQVTSRLYLSASGTPSYIPLGGGNIGQGVGGSGFLNRPFPLTFTPTRSGLVLTTGEIANLSNLSKNAASLGNAVLDATTLGSDVMSIREIAGLSQIQSWDGVNLAPGAVKQLPGVPISIDRVNANSVVAVTLGENGIPSFYLLGDDLAVVAPATLEAPTGIAVGASGSNSAEITWFDVSGEESYAIERRVSGTGDFEEVGTVTTSVTRFTDVGLAGEGTSYEYRLIAVNGDLRSAPSEVQEVRFELPDEVMGLRVMNLTENGGTASWDPLNGVTGYQVEALWIASNNNITPANPQPDAGQTSYTFTNLRLNTEYSFRVRGVNGLGVGPWVSLIRSTLPPAPSPPNNLRVSGTPSSFSAGIRWSGTVSGGIYVVERREKGMVDFVEVFRGETSIYQDQGLSALTTYEYRVRFENSRGFSPYTEVLEVTTGDLLPPDEPQQFFGVNVVGGVRLNWSYGFLFGGETNTTATSVVIERRTDESEEFTFLLELPLDEALTYLDESVTPGFKYEYRIFGKNRAGISTRVRNAIVTAIDGICLLDEEFDVAVDHPFVTIVGGEVVQPGGEGFPESGVMHFGAAFERSIVIGPLDLRYGGSIDLSGRLGDVVEGGSPFWDAPELNEIPFMEYLILDGSDGGFGSNNGWRSLGRLFALSQTPEPFAQTWNSQVVTFPSIDAETGVLIRIRQLDVDGPGLDTWALDRICILGHKAPNTPPVLDPAMPLTLSTNATGDPIRLNFSQWVTEQDLFDRTYYEIGAVSNPAIFSEFTVDLETGILNIEFAPQATGSSTLEVVTNDSSGGSASHIFTVNAPVLTAPTIVREGLVELNLITGKYEQTLTIANNGPRGIAGVQVVVTALNNGFVLDGFENNTIVSDAPLAPGETVSLVLEYHSEISGVAPRPDFEIEILSPTGVSQTPGGGDVALRSLSDSSQVFSFDSVVGQKYQIEYSYDMVTWSTSPAIVTAGANRVQWLDQGPPKTDCHPSECPLRFYRVVTVAGE